MTDTTIPENPFIQELLRRDATGEHVDEDDCIPLYIQEGRAEPWVKWFAWYPVKTLAGDTRWMRFVEMRRFHAAWWFLTGNIKWWEFRDVRHD